MTSTAPPVSHPVHAQSASPAASTAASGTASSNARSSYANAAATKGKQPSPPTIVNSNTPAAVGVPTPNHHAGSNSVSPVNGRPSAPPAVPTGASGPAIVNSSSVANGAPSQGEHNRKPSSVTISAQGTSYMPNGTTQRPSGKPPLQFGSIGNPPTPNLQNSTPHMPHASLGGNLNNPGPARSPSPIPQPPMASGGGLPPRVSAAGISFGSVQDGSEHTVSIFNYIVVPHSNFFNASSVAAGRHASRPSPIPPVAALAPRIFSVCA
jgi:translation initiation factor 4G